MYKRVSGLLHIFLLIVLSGTCASTLYYINRGPAAAAASAVPMPTRTAKATPTLAPVPSPSRAGPAETSPDTGWSLIQPGLERRIIPIYNGQNAKVEVVHIWRLDQRYFRLDVAYSARPKSLETWQSETSADLVVNGGFFSIENERYFPNGLTIVNGQASGRSFEGFGGMLAIDRNGAEVRWLVDQPYDAGEPLQAALQAFPILVKPGGELGFGAERENYAKARRTVIGQDRAGRILLIVTPQGYFTLHQLSVYLTESDLDLDVALNLDGGGSTGILVADPRDIIPSRVLLPFVVLVHSR